MNQPAPTTDPKHWHSDWHAKAARAWAMATIAVGVVTLSESLSTKLSSQTWEFPWELRVMVATNLPSMCIIGMLTTWQRDGRGSMYTIHKISAALFLVATLSVYSLFDDGGWYVTSLVSIVLTAIIYFVGWGGMPKSTTPDS